MKFDNLRKKNIRTIESGQWTKDREAGWDIITEKAWPAIIQMNGLGYLTTNSQAGEFKTLKNDERKIFRERAYVIGWMKREMGEKFVLEFNARTDKVAMLIQPVSVSRYSGIPATLIEHSDTGKLVYSLSLKLYNSKKQFESDKEEVKLDSNEDVVTVICFDPTWGRKAFRTDGLFTEIIDVLENPREIVHFSEEET